MRDGRFGSARTGSVRGRNAAGKRDATPLSPDMQHVAYRCAILRNVSNERGSGPEQPPRRDVARLDDRLVPLVIDEDQPARERRELRASVLRAAARNVEDRRAQRTLHLADAIDAGAIAHVARVAGAADRPRNVDRLEQPYVAWPDEKLAVAGEPPLEPRLHAPIEKPWRRISSRCALRFPRARSGPAWRARFPCDRY